MKVEIEIKKAKFTNEAGEVLEYFACVGDVCGEPIRFSIKKDDKKLFEYLTRDAKFDTVDGSKEGD